MKKLLFLAILALLVVGCKQKSGNGENAKGVQLSGAGATFPLPYYNIIFKNFGEKTNNEVTYGGIGSGGGIRSLKDKTVDFGASDAFLSEEEGKEMGAEVVHIPTCMGAVVLAYNLPDDVKGLKLNGDIISGIFMGKITKWNDPKIKSLNADLTLPDKAITPVYRSDGSGTTYVFSDYLTKASPEWEQEMGTGKALKWPVGIAAKGNPGVSGVIQQTEGSIGYIGSEYSFTLNIPVAVLQNSAGNFIEPTTESISAAANVDLPADMRTMITNSADPQAYPISCFTWIIVYKEQAYVDRTIEQAKALSGLLDYVLSTDAQSIASQVNYSPLPAAALQNAKVLLKSITYKGESVSQN